MNFKPMLACNADVSALRFPVLASPKYDGIRCVVLDGKALSRNLKPIPNEFTRGWLEKYCDGLDGELVVGDPTAKDCFQRTTSAVMSKDGEPGVTFHAFDRVDMPTMDFETRLSSITAFRSWPLVWGVLHTRVTSLAALNAYEAQFVSEGWEGVMLRDPQGLYKFGRSTVREGGLLKLKRFADAEAVIVGFEERMHNGNEAKVDALGHIERSTHKANKTGLGDLGAFVVKGEAWGDRTFNVGGGFTEAQRRDFWTKRAALFGKVITFKFQEVGTKDVPRIPIFKGFRPEGT